MTLPRLSLWLALVGAALLAAGVLIGPATFTGIEGAYFTRAAGAPAHSSAFTAWGTGLSLASPSDGNLWLGAGLVLLVAAAAGMFAHAAGVRLVRARD